MDVTLTKRLLDAVGTDKFRRFGVAPETVHWSRGSVLSLARFARTDIEKLITLITPHRSIPGTPSLLADCKLWLKATDGGVEKPARHMRQFYAMLRLHLSKVPGHRVYERDDDRGVWQAYYVNNLVFHPRHVQEGHVTPAHVEVNLLWTEFGSRDSRKFTFWPDDMRGRLPGDALAHAGFICETPELRAEYEERCARFGKFVGKLGLQFTAVGAATDDLDGNPSAKRDSWYWRNTTTIQLEKDGEPARVIIDVFHEEESSDDRENARSVPNRLYWREDDKKPARDMDDDPDDGDDEEMDDEVAEEIDTEMAPAPEIPLHPYLACFDLKRHLRLRIDVGQLTEYRYDPKLGDKLILPEDSRNLVEVLIAHKGGFRDIVVGKSGGAIILCAGVPGTGKTLTAEVYAEVMARPLYSVQASQLGLTSEVLEQSLLKVFARAQRWNAILLLDEADVYVAARGSDLVQNSIVGVFLRVLEYYRGVLFLTTNRSDLVDDAIASRCVARINFSAPGIENQKRIWAVLSTTAGITISDEVIEQAATRYPDLTGRDVKNLLKLAKLVSESRDCPITLDVIRFVKRFKPTVSSTTEGADIEPVVLPAIPEASEPEMEELTATVSEPVGSVESSPSDGPAKLAPAELARAVVIHTFIDGAPHAASEAKEAVKKATSEVHPNAVTNMINSMVKAGKLARLSSGLYQMVGS